MSQTKSSAFITAPMYSSKMIIPVLVLFCFCRGGMAAETAFFSAQIGADMITVAAQLRYADEMPYVALDEIMHQIGGAVAVQPEQVQANWGGTTAVLNVNGVTVKLPKTSFSLAHPVKQQGETVFISLSDVPAFFTSSYNLLFSQVEQAEQSQPLELTPIEPEEAAMDMQDDSLLESVDTPPSTGKESIALGTGEISEAGAKIEDEGAPSPAETPVAVAAVESQPAPQEKIVDLTPFSGVGGSIVLDPGHGGQDSGSVGGNGLNEKDVVLGIALRLRDVLAAKTSIKVQLTRDAEKEQSLSNRRAVAQTSGGTVYISLHAGYSATPRAQGTSIFTDQGVQSSESALTNEGKDRIVRRQQAAEKAGTFGYHLAQALGNDSVLGPVTVRSCPLLLQRDLDMPVVLIEIAYLSNIDAAELLSEEAYQDQVAQNLAMAIASTLK
jgi:N-acetylmuramoyl-L-alanine amidase